MEKSTRTRLHSSLILELALKTPSEVEIKFRIENLREISRQLKANGFRLKTKRTHEMNTLYDLPGQKLRRRGEILRLRNMAAIGS